MRGRRATCCARRRSPVSNCSNATLDLELVQVEPQRYSQRLVKATTVRGRIAEGRFTGLDSEGRLVIRREMPGAGEASYLLRPAEIARLELLER